MIQHLVELALHGVQHALSSSHHSSERKTSSGTSPYSLLDRPAPEPAPVQEPEPVPEPGYWRFKGGDSEFIEFRDPAEFRIRFTDPRSIIAGAENVAERGQWERAIQLYQQVMLRWPDKYGAAMRTRIDEIHARAMKSPPETSKNAE
jgi:hypothetical protein